MYSSTPQNQAIDTRISAFENYCLIFGFLFAVLLLWRLWTFTVLPFLYPEMPKTLPYWLPWLGHSIPFFQNADETLKRARLYFGNQRVPFALVLGGQYVYIVTSAKNASEVFRNYEQLSFNEYVKDIMLRFGATPEGVSRTWDTPSSHETRAKLHASRATRSVSHYCERIIQIQLHPGDEMHKLQREFLKHIDTSMAWSSIPSSIIHSATPTERTVSLQGWMQHSLLAPVTEIFYGHQILRLEPRFLKTFLKFDETGWKLMYKIPALFSKDMLESKEVMKSAFDRYFTLPPSEREDACWMIKRLEEELRDNGNSDSDISAYLLLLYWGINANAWKAAFWLVARIVHDPELQTMVEEEILPIVSQNLSVKELQYRLEKDCPVLIACYNEVMRTTVSSITARDVISECVIGDKTLQPGARVVIPYRQMLLDEQVFGADAESFNPHRFLKNPGLAKSSSFRPFGGGLAYCPGRFVAQMEIVCLTALIFGRFKLKIKDSRVCFPEMDAAKPCLGVMGATEGHDVILSVRERSDWLLDD
ncbi:cytochrome P450 [Bisporella sp. PMI_857]|nr:cytochrome P450 [Bisporella sp. PMI_857]